LIAYQAVRISIVDPGLAHPDLDPDRASFTVALNAAREQLVLAAGIITDTVIDLVGKIGGSVLDHLMPPRRTRTNPRVVKRAISTYVASTAKRRHRRPSRNATISINILATAAT
jgi:hypothetical protein